MSDLFTHWPPTSALVALLFFLYSGCCNQPQVERLDQLAGKAICNKKAKAQKERLKSAFPVFVTLCFPAGAEAEAVLTKHVRKV